MFYPQHNRLEVALNNKSNNNNNNNSNSDITAKNQSKKGIGEKTQNRGNVGGRQGYNGIKEIKGKERLKKGLFTSVKGSLDFCI